MSRPIAKHSLDSVVSAGAGEEFQIKGHNSIGMLVEAENLDPQADSLTVELEVRHENGPWSRVHDETATQVGIVTEADLSDVKSTGTYAIFLYIHGLAVEEARLDVTSYTDDAGADLTVDGYISATGNAGGRGHGYEL